MLIEEEEPTVDDETLWSEYFDTLDEAEVSCIRSALDGDDYDEMLARNVVSGQRVKDRHELEIWACLTQENSIDLYLSAFYPFKPDGDRTDDELAEIGACHRSLLEYVDFARYFESEVTDIDTYHWHVPPILKLIWRSMTQCWIKEPSDFIPYWNFPVYEARPINFVDGDRTGWSADDISVWGDGINEISEEERDCIRNEIGADAYGSVLAEAIFDGETEPWEVAIWGCLTTETAASFLKRTAAFDFVSRFEYWYQNDERFGRYSVRDEVACMDRVFERMDIPRLIGAGLPDVGVADYRHGVTAIIGFGLCYGPMPSVVEIDDHSDETDGATEIAIGSLVEGNLDAKFETESDQDVFQFIAEPGLVYELDLVYENWGVTKSTGDTRPYFTMALNKPDGWGFRTSKPVLWETSSGGVHYLSVSGAVPMRYEFKISIADYLDDRAGDFEAATEIPIGGTVEGNIRLVNENDFFKFVAEGGVNYQIDVELSDDYEPDQGHDDLTVTLIDTDRTPIGEISDRRVWQALTSGEFFLQVSGQASRDLQGSYSISVSESNYRDDHGDALDAATEIVVGRNVPGTLGEDPDEDYFYFDAVSGRAYEMSIETDVDQVFRFDMVDAEGDAISLEQSAFIWQAIEDGRYFIRVRSDEIGDYTLSLKASDYVDDHYENEPTAVLIGQPTEGYILNSTDRDAFKFAGVAGEAYDIAIELGTLNEVHFSVRDSKGKWMGPLDEEKSTVHAWETDDYLVYLYSPDEGSYTFTVSISDHRDDHGDDEENATALEFGGTVSGAIGFDAGYHWAAAGGNEGDHDVFSFLAERGQLYRFDIALGSLLRSRIKLFDPTGDVLRIVEKGLLCKAEMSGKHHVRISGLGVGDYELTVDRLDYSNDHGDDFSSATLIEVGETLSGTIELANELDFFRFRATEGETYEIRLIAESFENPQVSLFDADGSEIGIEPNFVDPPFVLTDTLSLNAEGLESKIYFIVVLTRQFYWAPRSLDDDWTPTTLDDPEHVGNYTLSIRVLE